jgi:hypothetical protein
MTEDNEKIHPMMMPADIPPDIAELAEHLLQQALQKTGGKMHPGDFAIACIIVASAFMALIENDDDRELILDTIGDIASDLVEVNRQCEEAAEEQGVGVPEMAERMNATGDVEPPTEH